ncbi:hypothetical protein J6TS7_27080 [Paenibacillus dendritiformis]|nr:hypothetical protein J6TS7_27080 [Paenibacillus dendritiformis]
MSEGAPLREGMRVDAELQLGFTLPCRLKIVHRSRHPEGMQYAASLEGLDEVSLRSLRAFILREQITAYVDKKQSV